MNLFEDVAQYTKSPPERLNAMAQAVLSCDLERIVGDIVECGVWRGGNIILARKLSPNRVCWLYDTFNGMPEPGPLDTKISGLPASISFHTKRRKGKRWDAVTLAEVRDNLEQTGTLDDHKLRFVEGKVEDTLLVPENLPDRIAVLRLDTDWHDSTKIELEILYPRLAPGGVLIIDDYGHWKGARRAVDDYFEGRAPSMTQIDYTAVSMIKPLC